MRFWQGDGKKTKNPAFGLQITAEDDGMMAGMFGFPMVDDELGLALIGASGSTFSCLEQECVRSDMLSPTFLELATLPPQSVR